MKTRNTVAFFLLAAVIFTIYSNVYPCTWHFDDYHIIQQNPNLHIDHLNADSLTGTFYAHPGLQHLYRPLPMLSFAINWYIHGDDVRGFHLVNNLIHLLAAVFLFLAVQSIMQTPGAKTVGSTNAYFIALLAATFWAVHPIQTQAITYIVQRMAAMAAMFYVASIYFYLQFRLSASFTKKAVLIGCCLSSACAAFLSKENTILLPISMLIIEMIFFQAVSRATKRVFQTKHAWIILAIVIVLVLGASAPFYGRLHDIILASYDQRAFTPVERLMTEARILWRYLAQIFYPTHHRLSILHVVPISTSLISPWTTLLSVISLIGILTLSLLGMRKTPFVSFAILFYLINHSVESSILGLELIYEHRNYLPSMFLFLPISVGCYGLLVKYYHQNKFLFSAVSSFIMIIIVLMGVFTTTRNDDWRSEKTLWEDVLSKYPHSTRAMHNLAHRYYEKNGDYNSALALYQHILSRDWDDGSAYFRKGLTLNNVAAIYYLNGMDELALSVWEQALSVHPPLIPAKLGLTRALVALGRWPDANRAADDLLAEARQFMGLNLKAFILFKQGQYEAAIPFLQESLQHQPANPEALVTLSAIHTALANHIRARFFLGHALKTKKDDPRILLMLIENAVSLNHRTDAETYAAILMSADDRDSVYRALKLSRKNEGIPIDLQAVYPFINDRLEYHAREWKSVIEAFTVNDNRQ